MFYAGLGGFFGTSARFLINRLVASFWKLPFPLATFTINVIGCLAFGLILGAMQKTGNISPRLNALLIVGFCGGFTTFSTFSYESLTLGFNVNSLLSLIYVCGSVTLGLIATWIGLQIAAAN